MEHRAETESTVLFDTFEPPSPPGSVSSSNDSCLGDEITDTSDTSQPALPFSDAPGDPGGYAQPRPQTSVMAFPRVTDSRRSSSFSSNTVVPMAVDRMSRSCSGNNPHTWFHDLERSQSSGYPPHLVYESFPEFRDDITDNAIPTFLEELKRKFNGAFVRHVKESDDGANQSLLGGQTVQTPSNSLASLDANAPPESSMPLDREPDARNSESGTGVELKRKLTSTSSLSTIGRLKGNLDHSEANRKQIADRINLLRRSKERKQYMQRFWMPDSTSSECYNCSKPFTNFRRRHHCRICGNIFCNMCCSNYLAIMIGLDESKSRTERTCNYCRETAENFCSPNSLSAIVSKSAPSSNASTLSRRPSAVLPKPSDIPHWVKKFALIGRSEEYSTYQVDGAHREKLLQDCQLDLMRIWQEMMESRQGLPFMKVRYRLRNYTDCMSGQAIVEWFRKNEKIRGPEATLQAMWLGQALIDARFLTPLNRKNTEFKSSPNVFYRSGGENAFLMSFSYSDKELIKNQMSRGSSSVYGVAEQLPEAEPPWVQHVHASSSSGESDSEGEGEVGRQHRSESFVDSEARYGPSISLPSSALDAINSQGPPTFTESYDFYAELTNNLRREGLIVNKQQPTIDFFRLLPPNVEFDSSLFEQPPPSAPIVPSPSARVKDEESVLSERQSIQEISKNAYLMHMIAFLHQLLCYYGVDFRWAPLLFRFCKVLGESVKPNIRKGDSMDIRRYVKVKVVPGGGIDDSRIINGVAFSGNVTCKGMANEIKGPDHLLLCKGSVECNNHRNSEGDPTRMVSLQTILSQKKMFNELCTKRILAVQPPVSLVLMEFTVVNWVQKMLMEQDIAVVNNVKRANLMRLSRVLECEVADRVENLGLTDAHYTPGQFNKFYVENFQIGLENKSICVFDDCMKEKYATVILRGSHSLHELKKVKHILMEMVLANYNRVLERSYFLDSNAQHRFFFKHLPFTTNIMHFTSQYLSKVVPPRHMADLQKRSDAVKRIMELDSPATSSGSSPTHLAKHQKKFTFQAPKVAVMNATEAMNATSVEAPYEPNEHSLFSIHRQLFRSTVLSMSPHVLISCPFLESNLGFNSPLRRYLFASKDKSSNSISETSEVKYWSGLFPGEVCLPPIFKYDGRVENLEDVEPDFDLEMLPFQESAIFEPSNLVDLPPHPFLSYVSGKCLDGAEFMDLLADFRLRGYNLAFDDIKNIERRHNERMVEKRKAFEVKMNKRRLHFFSRKNKPDCLDYRYHQKINVLVLITSNNPTSKDPSKFCCYLVYRYLPFYLDTDMTLGSFLEKLCFKNNVCVNQSCELPAEVHMRRFYNANYCLQVSLHTKDIRPHQETPDTILMWNFCPACKKMSQITKMSDNTWNYSFGKFLENCLSAFNVGVFHSKDSSSVESVSNQESEDPCSHSLFRDHHQYFMYKKRVAAFRVFSVNVYEVAFPEQFSLVGTYAYSTRKFADDQKQLTAKFEGIVNEMNSRLNHCAEFLKSCNEAVQSATASTSRKRNFSHITEICRSLDKFLEEEKEKCLQDMKKQLKNAELLESSDWARSDAILLMKFTVFCFWQKCSLNLSRLTKAENDFKSTLSKEKVLGGFTQQPIQAQLNEDTKSSKSVLSADMRHHSCSSDKPEDLEASTESTGSKSNLEVFDDDAFYPAADTERRVNGRVVNVNATNEANQLSREPIATPIVAVAASSTAAQATSAIKIVEQDKRSVEKGINLGIDKLTFPNSSPKIVSHTDIEDSYDVIDNKRTRPSKTRFLKNNRLVGKSADRKHVETRGQISSTSAISSQLREAVEPLHQTHIDAPRNSECHATVDDVGKRVSVTYDAQTFFGTLKWVGHLNRSQSDTSADLGILGGIELDEEQTNCGNGYYNDVKVFDCEPNRAVFAPLVGVFLIGEDEDSKVSFPSEQTTLIASRKNRPCPELAKFTVFMDNEHFIFSPDDDQFIPILIREDEPGSIIAFSIASKYYRSRLAKLETESAALYNNNSSTWYVEKPTVDDFRGDTNESYATSSPGNPNRDTNASLQARDPQGTITTTGSTGVLFVQNSVSRLKQAFIEHNFSSGTEKERRCEFYCKSWYPAEFKNLRKRVFLHKEEEEVEKWFIKCLSESKEVKMSAGNSKSHFYQTETRRFILKTLKPLEVQDFVEPGFATSYFHYMNKCLDEGLPTTLCKIFGVYKVSFKNSWTDATKRYDFIIMEDLFANREFSRKFDLKGVHKVLGASELSYKAVVEHQKMIMDQHMTSVIQEDPILTRPHDKHLLMEAIERDCNFLKDNRRLDYSLLIGLDDARSEMVVGIVDYVREFGLDKKFEMVTKTVRNYMLTGGAKSVDPMEDWPTIVSPDIYRKRFLIQMRQFILTVPDRWFGLESGLEKWSCGMRSQEQDWAYSGSRFDRGQTLDPYPTYLNYWETNAASKHSMADDN